MGSDGGSLQQGGARGVSSSQDLVLSIMEEQGKADAIDLRNRSPEMDGTGLIAEESKIPDFNPKQNYEKWPVGSPVRDGGQVWILLIPHNAAAYVGRPATLRTLWGLAHTTDPLKAKGWVDPYGTSGLYYLNECYKDDSGLVRQQIYDGGNEYPASVRPERWKLRSVQEA